MSIRRLPFKQHFGARIEHLTNHPRLGPRRPDIRQATRMLVEGTYLILYETRPDTDEDLVDEVEIVRVVDGRRKWQVSSETVARRGVYR
jgi:plasmid stabilization system protein ParE